MSDDKAPELERARQAILGQMPKESAPAEIFLITEYRWKGSACENVSYVGPAFLSREEAEKEREEKYQDGWCDGFRYTFSVEARELIQIPEEPAPKFGFFGAQQQELMQAFMLPERLLSGPAATEIVAELVKILETLLEKNASYGNSALEPLRIFSKADPAEQIRIRIDDKLSRLARGAEIGEDTILDLIGYLMLYRVALKRAQSRPPTP